MPPVQQSKKASILALLQRPQGAAIGDLTAATGWQTHSVRAALTGLRKEGNELARVKNEGGVTHYRLAATA
jgi:predicted ArsR family transcriptional regulator